MRKQVLIPMVSVSSETNPILAIAHCESNPNPMVLEFPEPNPTLTFAHCEATQIQWFPNF